MRELDTASPVVWPAWCYSGDSQEGERGSGRRKGGSRQSRSKMTTVESGAAAAVKAERLSPSSSAPGDAASSSSRSGTPSSSYRGTPPGAQGQGLTLSPTQPPIKHMEAMNRNYSDFMRSLAAKYNNNHPNDYFSGRNGFGSGVGGLKAGTSPPFSGLLPPPSPAAPSGAASKEEEKTPAEAQAMIGFVPFPPVFPPVIDMNATQALLSMVRSHAGAAHQLETYLKGAAKRSPTESLNSPLDLSSSSTQPPLPAKRHKKTSLGESLYGAELVPLLRQASAKKSVAQSSQSQSQSSGARKQQSRSCVSACSQERPCSSAPDSQTITHWTVEDVASFVATVDMCAEYAANFREQRIDGSSLPLLTEDHLTSALGMKLGPALKLRSILSSRLGQCAVCLHCAHCHGPQSDK